ncbi:uncharacterized protein [Macrobrachium rosenbergii]|uniref:uncharacterized protein n=1 Tax=Macrobrachium rosenbergii TaxID=79674 RepID=UPI0034D4DE36
MGDGLGYSDKDAILNTDSVTAAEQQVSSSSEPGNGEVGSSVSGSAAIASVVKGTHNASQGADMINNGQSASGPEKSEVGSSLSGSVVQSSLGPSAAEGCLQASLNDVQYNCSSRNKDGRAQAMPPTPPSARENGTEGQEDIVRQDEEGGPESEIGPDHNLQYHGGVQAMPPPPPRPVSENSVERQEDIAGQGNQRDPIPEIINSPRRDGNESDHILDYEAQGMLPPLNENDQVGDLAESPEPEIVNIFEDDIDILIDEADFDFEGFAYLPYGFDFQN